MHTSGILSPDNDTFSTPPTTPNAPMESIAPSLSRRSSRPTSLSIDQTGWMSDIVLEESSPQLLRKPNGVVPPPAVAHDRTVTPRSSTTNMPSTGAPEHARPNHKPMDSPCFVHSQLDKGASLTEWLRNRQHAQGDVGVARSLQQQEVAQTVRDQESPDTSYPSSSLSSFESDFDEDDDFRGSLTKQLAETAVSVREMSKQLGRARVHSSIQSILIVTKARDNRLIRLTRQLALYLMLKHQSGQKRGMVVYVDSQLRHSRRFDAEGIRRDHPELFQPFPRRRASSNSVSSLSSLWEKGDDTTTEDEGQLRYWTSSMCSRSPHLFDFVVTLGGDGTVLFTSWLFQRIVPPVLSFALGSLGFLTNFDFAKYQGVMDTAIDSGIRVNLRMRFTCTVYRAVTNEEGRSRKAVKRGQTGEILMNNLEKGGWEALEDGWCSAPPGEARLGKDKEIMCFTTRPVETFEVLNDLVVDRGPSPYVSLLELFGDEHHMTTVQADGLTVSTPTGSTAYSLSAGGSLVHPEIPALLITPICPHTLSFRPMLLPDSMELRICVPYNSRSTAWASFDGRGRIELKQGDHIKVAASKYPFPTVCADKQSTDWFHAISRTLKWNERERQKSFVVVEEEGPSRHKRRSKRDTLTSEQLKSPINEIPDEEEDEVSDEEDDTFDIDDSSSEATTLNPASVANNLTSEEERLGKEKVHDMLLENALDNALKKGQRKRSKSRQRSSSSGLRSGVDSPSRFAGQPPHPPAISPRHIYNGNSSDLEAPKLAQHHAAEIQAPSLDKQLHKVLAYTKEKEGDVENIKTPTAYTLVHGKMRTEPRIRPQEQHGHRAFAVWGQDESDSNASDSDV